MKKYIKIQHTVSNILFILSNPIFLIILNLLIFYRKFIITPPPTHTHTHTHTQTHTALDDFSKPRILHVIFRSDKNFVGQTNLHTLSDRMSCKVLATFVNTAVPGN